MNYLDITNHDRLRHYPSGKCPLCGSQNFSAYLLIDDDPDVETESGLRCDSCGETYRTEEPIAWIDHESVYRQ